MTVVPSAPANAAMPSCQSGTRSPLESLLPAGEISAYEKPSGNARPSVPLNPAQDRQIRPIGNRQQACGRATRRCPPSRADRTWWRQQCHLRFPASGVGRTSPREVFRAASPAISRFSCFLCQDPKTGRPGNLGLFAIPPEPGHRIGLSRDDHQRIDSCRNESRSRKAAWGNHPGVQRASHEGPRREQTTPPRIGGLTGWQAGGLARSWRPFDSRDKSRHESMETWRVESETVRSMIEDDIASGAAPLQPR